MLTGLEPAISAVTGRHPNQLNEYTYLKYKKTFIYKLLNHFSFLTRELFVTHSNANVHTRAFVYMGTHKYCLCVRLTTLTLLGEIKGFIL